MINIKYKPPSYFDKLPSKVLSGAEKALSEEGSSLSEYIKKLPPSQREIVTDYYVNNLTMKQIGNKRGISESRISQILKGIIQELRSHFQK